MKNNKEIKNIIKCPYCQREYLPCEIYYPNYFLGQEKNIEKDALGKIIFYDGLDADATETYICDKCGNQFKVIADIKFNVYEDNRNNLEQDYFTPKPVKLFLDEE